MTEETRRQIKQYETRPDSNYVSINAGTLEQIIDDALQADQERLVSEIISLESNIKKPYGFFTDNDIGYTTALKDILNLINPPSN